MIKNIHTVIYHINHHCDELEFVEARRLIEMHKQKLSESKYYKLLNTDAKVLLKHVLDEEKYSKEGEPLTRLELMVLNNINAYCRDFDISMLKRTLKNYLYLLQREDAWRLLNNDAQSLLTSIGAILGANELKK